MKVAGENQVLTTMQILFSHGDRTHRWPPRTRGGRGYGQLLLVGAFFVTSSFHLMDGGRLHGAVAIADSFLLG
ncbi:MAG: hypothetical protein V7K21_26620 [Nostoc sp.]|uniref:hypothetical protein n=1 Tax=Nostoc sp. TaxID=1180 RepID=UPI002FF4C8D2